MTAPAVISYLAYGWESTFGTASSTITNAFGHGVRITGLNRKNNIEKVFSCGYRNAQKLAVKRYEGALSVEFILANPWFLRGVVGAASTTGSNPYTHTFAEDDTLESMTIENNISTAAVRRAQLLGAKIANTTISSAVGELVRVRTDMPFANEAFATTSTSVVADSFDLFTFAQGSIEMPNGSTLAMVQNMECTISNSPEPIWGQGSRFAQESPVKQRDYSANITMALQASADLLEDFYGGATGPQAIPAETATMELNFTNSLTGTNERRISLLFTGVQFDDENLPQDPTQVIMEDVSLMMRSCTVTAVNSTQTAQ